MQKIRDTVDIHLDQQNRNFGSLYSPHTIQSKPPLSHLCKFNTIPCVMMLSTRQSTAHCSLLLGKPHAHTHKHTHVHTHEDMPYTRTRAHACTHTHTRAHAHAHTHEHPHIRAHAHTHKHMHARTHMHAHARARALMRTQNIPGDSCISESTMRPSVVRETQRLRDKKLDRGAKSSSPG